MWPEILGAMVEGFALSLFLWTVIRGQKRLTWGQKEKKFEHIWVKRTK